MSFSQKYGFKAIKNLIQKDSIDDELRNGLWNLIKMNILDKLENIYYPHVMSYFMIPLWHNYFKLPIDTVSPFLHVNIQNIRTYYMDCPWFEVYDFIEFIATKTGLSSYGIYYDHFRKLCNDVLEREMSAYRFVGDKIAPITDEEEIAVIDEALNVTNLLTPVNIHLQVALEKLSNKKTPDYRNSIKESISAVEAICQLITKEPKATLGRCIKQIEDAANIHPALKKSFEILYGYTSDADGIRHALMNESNLQFEDAKFMMVVCCGFINYLISKVSRAGICL